MSVRTSFHGGLVLPAWRNFVRNIKRYRVLLTALVLIVTALVVVLGVMSGLRGAVREKAGRYFAGDLVVLGFVGNGSSRIDDPAVVERAIADLSATAGGGSLAGVSDDRLPADQPASSGVSREDVELRTWSRRSTYYQINDIELFFSGYYTRQRRLVGVEWRLERPVLSGFDMVSGSVPEDGDETSILISTATARDLGIAVGDEVVVSIRSDRGRTNTADFVVAGIFSESSFFGYTAYLHRLALNRLREAPPETVNEMGVYLVHEEDEARAAAALTAALGRSGLATFPVLTDRDAYSLAARAARDGREYGVVTLGAQLAEINDLLGAITIVAGVIMVLFLGIVTVGVSNTWTMVVWERTREIGTLRALGMQRTATMTLFMLEALFLGGVGVILGGATGVGILAGTARWVRFEPNAFTTLFFTQGRLPWAVSGPGLAAIAALAIGASVLGALRAAVRAGRVHPVEALRHEK